MVTLLQSAQHDTAHHDEHKTDKTRPTLRWCSSESITFMCCAVPSWDCSSADMPLLAAASACADG
jgi:hypothetical protein